MSRVSPSSNSTARGRRPVSRSGRPDDGVERVSPSVAMVAQTSRLPDVLQFMRALWAVVHALDSTSKRMSRSLGVTGPQRLVLRVVGLFPGTSPGSLASLMHLHPSTLTGIVQRLVDQRLLTRTVVPEDGRRVRLALTRRGQQVNEVQTGTVEEAVADVLAGLSASERAAAKKALERLAQRLAPSDG